MIIVECKKDPLRGDHAAQLRAYIRTLEKEGCRVLSAYLVGMPPNTDLDPGIIEEKPPIQVKELITDIPYRLALCRKGHYFDRNLPRCPYCNADRYPGQFVDLL